MESPHAGEPVSLYFPEIRELVKSLEGGLFPIRLSPNSVPVLVIKAPKEFLLTAKINRSIKIYVVPDRSDATKACGIVTAFFDDYDEPLIIRTVFSEGTLSSLLTEVFSSSGFNLHLLDDHDREHLGYRAYGQMPERFLESLKGGPIDHPRDTLAECLGHIEKWFKRRVPDDDEAALNIVLKEPLFPEDLAIIDLTATSNKIQPNQTTLPSTLDQSEPGPFQESDIVRALQRVFHPDQIYLNPIRSDTSRELVDVLVSTEKGLFLIQAKDSPNTEASLRRTLKRKKASVHQQLEKAGRQLIGALSHVRRSKILGLHIGGQAITIETTNKYVVGLIVVKELFDADYVKYAEKARSIMEEADRYCFILDYLDLNRLTQNRRSEDEFISALNMMLEFFLQKRVFPRPTFVVERWLTLSNSKQKKSNDGPTSIQNPVSSHAKAYMALSDLRLRCSNAR